MRTILQQCQDVMRITGYTPITVITSSSAPDAQKWKAIVNEAGNDLASEKAWRRLTFEATISSSATVAYALPSDFYEIVNDTMWSRTETELASGPLNEQEWQMLKGQDAVSALVPEFRIEYIQGTPTLIFLEAPGAQTLYYEYRSQNWIVHTSSSAAASLWTSDAERSLFDDHLFYRELKWRWQKAKGSEYGVDFTHADIQRDIKSSQDKGGSKKLSLNGR
jgi:hypothetical protein